VLVIPVALALFVEYVPPETTTRTCRFAGIPCVAFSVRTTDVPAESVEAPVMRKVPPLEKSR